MSETRGSGPVDRVVRRFRDWWFVKRWGCLPPKPFRTNGLAAWWYDNGCPNKVGTLVREKMQSGRVAVFRLVNIERAWNCDWYWYDFEFVRYEVGPNAELSGAGSGAATEPGRSPASDLSA